jgi:hypothetical protein
MLSSPVFPTTGGGHSQIMHYFGFILAGGALVRLGVCHVFLNNSQNNQRKKQRRRLFWNMAWSNNGRSAKINVEVQSC